MTIQDDLNAATGEHKTAMAVHAVMNSISDLSNLRDLSPKDIEDLDLSYAVLGNLLLELHKKKAA